jgi:branched-chain amino acid transport system permease protein
MDRTKVLAVLTVLGLALVPVAAWAFDQPFWIDLFARVAIFAIAALSLDLILGFAGLVSFGHAIYMGLGAYTVGILSYHGVTSGLVHFPAAIAVSALAALMIGAISLRTSGVFFIMITLAFGQMGYFLAISITPMAATTVCRSPARAISAACCAWMICTSSTISSSLFWRCFCGSVSGW